MPCSLRTIVIDFSLRVHDLFNLKFLVSLIVSGVGSVAWHDLKLGQLLVDVPSNSVPSFTSAHLEYKTNCGAKVLWVGVHIPALGVLPGYRRRPVLIPYAPNC